MDININDRIVNYLIQMELPYEEKEGNIWVVKDEVNDINIAIHYDNPIVIFRVKLMNVPSSNKEKFYEKLLRLNVESLVQGAYGLEGDMLVITDTLQAENLDFNEFQASIDSIIMAITNDYKELSEFFEK